MLFSVTFVYFVYLSRVLIMRLYSFKAKMIMILCTHQCFQSPASTFISKYEYSYCSHQHNNHHHRNHLPSRSSSLSSPLSHSQSTSSSLPHPLPLGRNITSNIHLAHIGVQQTTIAETFDPPPNHHSSKTKVGKNYTIKRIEKRI